MAPYSLYTWSTPNGWKTSILMEELKVEYKMEPVDLWKAAQKEPEFVAINPNGRIPALVDHVEDVTVFETGAILWYIVAKEDKAGKFWPKDLSKQAEVMSWLMFQMGGVGPMQGQANHFLLYADEKVFYGMNRFLEETKRMYQVMDKWLADKEWLAAGQYSIADIATFPWVFVAPWAGLELADFPNLKRWHDRILARPAVQHGLTLPNEGFLYKLMMFEQDKTRQEARDILLKAKKAADATKSTQNGP